MKSWEDFGVAYEVTSSESFVKITVVIIIISSDPQHLQCVNEASPQVFIAIVRLVFAIAIVNLIFKRRHCRPFMRSLTNDRNGRIMYTLPYALSAILFLN